MRTSLIALLLAALLDVLLGDPLGSFHIVVGIGKVISWLEKGLRKFLPASPTGERTGGILLVFLVCVFSFSCSYMILLLSYHLSWILGFLLETFLTWQCLALGSLKKAAKKVKNACSDLPLARRTVGEIVGRETGELSLAGVIRACVETVAENANDGVIAPLLYLTLGGAPLGVLYKAINTMDSMVGYENEKYRYFGWAAAKLDDCAGFLPARLSGLLFVAASFFAGLDGKGAWRCFLRDRNKTKSPNAGQTEAACAGALGVRLGGSAVYFGKTVEKPWLGDDTRPICPEDIDGALRLLSISSGFAFLLCLLGKGLLFLR